MAKGVDHPQKAKKNKKQKMGFGLLGVAEPPPDRLAQKWGGWTIPFWPRGWLEPPLVFFFLFLFFFLSSFFFLFYFKFIAKMMSFWVG
jgi:hypothetical protein